MKRFLYLSSLFLILSFTLPAGFISCEREAKKAQKRVTDFTDRDFEQVVSSIDRYYIDKNINKNRAFTDAAVFALMSLPHPLYLYPESYYSEREKYEDKDDIYPGKEFKISPSDKFVIFDPDYEQVEKIQKEKLKKNENKKLSDEELKKLIEKEKLRKSVIAAKWEETNFSKKDFDRILAYISENLKTYKEPVLKSLTEIDGELDEESEEVKKEFSMEQVFLAAANGYLNSLDPHSSVFLKEMWEESMAKISDGSFEGIGAILSGGGNREVIVESPLEGSPAVRAGVRSGDTIVAVDNKLIKGLSLDKVVKKIKGKKGTKVVLTIKRKGNTANLDIEVIRDKITIKNVSYHLLKENPQIGYIKLTGFVKAAGEEPVESVIVKGLRSLEEEAKTNGKELKALVLDLRNNSGGYLDLAVDIADMFITKGLIVSTKIPNKASSEESYATKEDITKLPLVVLINAKSASASEIVASAIQHHGRGLLLGERTFGKATVQRLIDPLPGNDDYVLKLTNSRYYSPSGKTIQVVGVSPDIEVSEEADGGFPFRYREEDMWNHLPKIPYDGQVKSRFNIEAINAYVKKNGKAEAYLKQHSNDAIKPDYMLVRAVDYIEGFLNTK
ncbi:periplasmic protease [Leptospira ryugenii]|uniref:Periplasmic protease n=1 Tax=Leptospira ryugenii TaxID=1917863 RepID=A0A2P2E0B1_9LEPT|nr:S41 family peptidase [Leptospira ryugenii]GBF50311.1 periplasmic protease [Leptospira ryugenii]